LGESRRPSWRGRQSRVARAGERGTRVQVASCSAGSGLAGIAEVGWAEGRATRLGKVASYSEWAAYWAMKVRVALSGPGQSRRERERRKRKKRKRPKNRSSRFHRDAQNAKDRPLHAERIQCSWMVKEYGAMGRRRKKQVPRSADSSGTQKARYARNDNLLGWRRTGQGVGAVWVTRKKRKSQKSRA
jgi:hypothetical protein